MGQLKDPGRPVVASRDLKHAALRRRVGAHRRLHRSLVNLLAASTFINSLDLILTAVRCACSACGGAWHPKYSK